MRKLSALHPPMTASPATASAMYGCALASFSRPAAESWYFAQHACADACVVSDVGEVTRNTSLNGNRYEERIGKLEPRAVAMREGSRAEGRHEMENQRYSIAMPCAAQLGEHGVYIAS
jgi:hypothetical protein